MNKKASIVLVFLLGMVAGAAASRLAWRVWKPHPPQPEKLVARMAAELSLDQGQRAQLEELFRSQEPRMREFHRSTQERFEALKAEMDEKIASILRPDQQVKFAELKSKLEKRRLRHGMSPPFFPPAKEPGAK